MERTKPFIQLKADHFIVKTPKGFFGVFHGKPEDWYWDEAEGRPGLTEYAYKPYSQPLFEDVARKYRERILQRVIMPAPRIVTGKRRKNPLVS